MRQALTELRHEQENRHVEISSSELPVCEADPALLKQVWINLFANALKFTHNRPPKSRSAVNKQVSPYILSKTMGFDMQYAHKLFGVFQRLHR